MVDCCYPDVLRPSGKLYLGTDQLNLVHGADTKVTLDTIATDFVDAIEDTANHKITPGYAGFYIVLGMVTFKNVVAAKTYRAGILVSNTFWPCYSVGHYGHGTQLSVPVLGLVSLTASDYVELWARSNSGDNTVDVYGHESYTYLTAQRVR